MKFKIIKNKGLFKRFYCEIDLGYTFKEDAEEYLNAVMGIFKDWEKEIKKK